MFELPVVDGYENGQTFLAERKLRYRYFNQSHKRYLHYLQSKSQTDIVPVNEHEEGRDEENEEDIELRHNHEERLYFKRYEKPQNSYEIWRLDNKKRKREPLQQGTMTYSDISDIEEYGKRKSQHLYYSNHKLVETFQNQVDGYELLKKRKSTIVKNVDLKVIETLIQLLHVNIIRRKWNIAYRVFAQLVRIPSVDIRSIWNLGVEIMSHAQENNDPEQKMTLEFLEWMTKVYSSRAKYIEGINHKLAPMFRSSSKDHTAAYVTTLLWRSLYVAAAHTLDNDHYTDDTNKTSDAALQTLIEKIDDMLIIPTYMEESEIWFVQAMCHVVKTDYLTRQMSVERVGSINDIRRNDVTAAIKTAERCLQECLERTAGDTVQFAFPDRYIRRQLRQLEQRISNK
ncbi:similar to Saccharomyces cerevisiae YML043C RRN11 Component of the core factor (CF) rDNA transcription factor complex [Maudiozyma barnettii]|uniref:Similar to Saccharomyces cerevisiae YML043C RRN11 Component of the core factor (CF) rDNA transcription factor complex n=1 Tax=Maudiozyma barnettii TaxID=61262 RepID=A0A8H2VHS2_9SACH|nr:Rrn11p [Kazachstania barnettii]CAB4255553.1 similar to Saccharomyces cerevisiae YML043C RRN11 Component of the core factor (CF) rDNA transcription factor complex [Kazachstania barnettii]CAD1784051.1 similar to Saccharomyces cerevisiae YML043C RRN11 Component of the core factor (CF) rDNA transcription factor complex [Kazachstania barnettii]